MRHPALTRFFAAFLAVVSAITLISGGICIRKAADSRGKQNMNTARLSEKTAEAKELRAAIERVFGYAIHDIPAYRYYDGCEVMRSWICMPLCVGIYDRAAATVQALTSEYLMRTDGFLTSEGRETLWDRSTLYSLRGIFASGSSDRARELLKRYVDNRLLG